MDRFIALVFLAEPIFLMTVGTQLNADCPALMTTHLLTMISGFIGMKVGDII